MAITDKARTMAKAIMGATLNYQNRMKIKSIKIGSRWIDPTTRKIYEVWCVANVGGDPVSDDEHLVILKQPESFGYYSMAVDIFPGQLKQEKDDGEKETSGEGR